MNLYICKINNTYKTVMTKNHIPDNCYIIDDYIVELINKYNVDLFDICEIYEDDNGEIIALISEQKLADIININNRRNYEFSK